eukprot:TRINITY_DN10609_c0_g1_i1.p1 TRINITY_DN10609_c0_g1~~TRINITY_DN10609_c0_g1_i1.p1  ORF type:complete len:450 (-),score=89.48 TRINITY_DN10609_c0_g1_i1:36-1385(-)
MFEFIFVTFIVLLLLCILIEWFARQGEHKHVEKISGFTSFQIKFLSIYLINMSADWMQGPYIYALYEYYGFKKEEIAHLFIGGFFSSLVFGTYVGAVADKFGRKKLAVAFAIFYSMSCLTKLSRDFWMLMLGRLLSGVATSLLFSVFESWMVHEHYSKGYSSEGLSQTFSYSTFGNGVVAILSGLVASFIADTFGYVGPFMLALAFLICGAFGVMALWSENYGDTTVDVAGTFTNAINALQADKKVAILGIVQSLFEASMYTFVFMWTPALADENSEPLPFGLIFAAYMVSMMIGSSVFKILNLRAGLTSEVLARYIFGIAAVSLFLPVVLKNKQIILLSFFMFEMMCGMYFPCMGTLRGKYIPENTRSAIMNFFRVPLNLLVVLVLVKVSAMQNSTVFLICTLWLLLALYGTNEFIKMAAATARFVELRPPSPLPSRNHDNHHAEEEI